MNYSGANQQLKQVKSNFIFTILITLLFALSGYTQNSINYKAVIKDASGNIMESQPVSIQFIIYEGAALSNNVYQETHTINTDDNGIIIVNIGEGVTANNFSTINWQDDEHFLNVQLNTGSGLVDLGTTQFNAVPYALVAKDVENSIWNINDNNTFYSEGNVGIGINAPLNTFSVLQPIGINNTVRIETQDHPTGKDLVELIVPAGSTSGSQFIEMQNGSNIVAAINSDGSAKFKSIQFEDTSVQTTAAVGPVAYGFVQSSSIVSSGSNNFTVVWDAAYSRYEISIYGENYFWSHYTTNVTSSSYAISNIRVSSSNNNLLVYLYNSAGALIQGNFQFITYK